MLSDDRLPYRIAAAGEYPRAKIGAVIPSPHRSYAQRQHPLPPSAPTLQGMVDEYTQAGARSSTIPCPPPGTPAVSGASAPPSSVCSPSDNTPQTVGGTPCLSGTPAKLDSTPRSANYRCRTSTRHASNESSSTLESPKQRHQVQLVCDRLLGDLLAQGYDLLNARSIPSLAHLLARWHGVAIVLLADGPSPETTLPEEIPFFALELETGEVAIIYHAKLSPTQQQRAILHLLAHFLLLWSLPSTTTHPSGSAPIGKTFDLQAYAFGGLLDGPHSLEERLPTTQFNRQGQQRQSGISPNPAPVTRRPLATRPQWSTCVDYMQQDVQAAAGAAHPALERYAIELTHRFQHILHR